MANGETTRLLKQAAQGCCEALEELNPRISSELRKIAARLLQREPPDQALQTTMLVDDVLLHLHAGDIEATRINKKYFYGAATHMMKRSLIDAARIRNAGKRSAQITSLSDITEPAHWYDVLARVEIDDAFDSLAEANPDAFTAFFLVYLVRMSQSEVADRLQTSVDHIRNLIQLARMFLNNAIKGS